ncbi:hypothetical protein [Streptomyces sp. NPDC056628]|uniref:hypothetical protein n=1 Tax=Streptomyces sp. NPDC056628 TaxID=3345882 RepID=UPI0036BEF4E1
MSARAPKARTSPRRPRARTTLAALLLIALSATGLVACGGDDGGGAASPAPPVTASFSGSPAPGLSSLEASARERASAAASSASARASEFEASVSAEIKRANDAARERLKHVEGRGNATADVSLTGKPRADTGNLPAVVVAITNRTDDTASYAVQVDFRDPDGKVVESRFVGAEDLEPGERAEPVAISRKPPEPRPTAEIAKAQRY